MKHTLSLLTLLASGCIFVVSKEEQPTSKESSTTKQSGDVTYLSVDAKPTPGGIDGYQLAVKISLEVNTRMPNVAPHIVVSAECKIGTEVYTNKEDAFFMSLSEATPGNKKEDTAALFFLPTLPKKPERCDLTLQLSKGEGSPQSYCYQNETTKPGKCPTI